MPEKSSVRMDAAGFWGRPADRDADWLSFLVLLFWILCNGIWLCFTETELTGINLSLGEYTVTATWDKE